MTTNVVIINDYLDVLWVLECLFFNYEYDDEDSCDRSESNFELSEGAKTFVLFSRDSAWG
jgi:hypothetical protein